MDIIEKFFNVLGFEYDNGVRCKCGQHKQCVSKVTISGAGVLSRKSNELVKCGKFQEQAALAREVAKFHKLRAEFESKKANMKIRQMNIINARKSRDEVDNR